MMENPFKNAQVVAVSGNEEAPDLVYIDDDEEEPRLTGMTAIQIELKEDGESKRSSTPFNSDTDQENPIDIKIEPIETNEIVQKLSGGEDKDSYELLRTCDIDTDSLMNLESELSIIDQEQFEIIRDLEDKDTSSTSSNDSIRANKSNESNDHSYSQPPPRDKNSLCDDIVKNLLVETSLQESQNAITLLKKFTNYFEDLVLNEDHSSQLYLYVKQMISSLENSENNFPIKTVNNEEKTDKSCSSSKNVPEENPKVEEIITQVIDEPLSMDVSNEPGSSGCSNIENVEFSETSIKSDIVQIKQETVEGNTGITDGNGESKIETNGKIDEGAEQLKVYVKKAHEKTAEFSENNQKLLDSVYVTEEDVENGSSKFKTSLYNFISFNVALFMDVENKSDSTVDDEISKLKIEISKSRKKSNDSSKNNLSDCEEPPMSRKKSKDSPSTSRKSSVDDREKPSRKSSTSSINKDSSDSDSDSSINRLTNLKTLDQKSKKYEKQHNSHEKPPSQEVIKKSQKARKKSTEDSNTSALDSDTSESENDDTATNKNDKNDENSSSEDEEIKMKQRLEMKARHNLLASSDDDEESYVTSESSDLYSDDERVEIKKRKPVKKLESSDELEAADNLNKSSEKPINPEIVNGSDNAESIVENPVSVDEQSATINGKIDEDEKKGKKRRRQNSFDREIFDKSLLDDSEGDDQSDNGEQASKKARKNSQKNGTNAKKTDSIVDLTQTANQSDRMAPSLEKYLEKITHCDVEDLTKLDEPTSSTNIKTNDSSPKKNDPSPIIDDIDCISISSESDSEISSTVSEGPTRRRKQLTEEELKEETKKAKKDEMERVKKLEAKEQRMTQYLSQRLSQSDIIASDELVLDCCEEKDLTIVVHQNLVGKLKEHQVDGIKFMYNNCYGSIDEVKENNGSGCILAHCMGLGKTLQLIVLLHTVTRYPELCTKRVLIICPKSTIHNWAEEFRKWLGCVDNRPVVYYLEDNLKIEKRIDKLREWFESRKPSVFLINYESFRTLANWSGSNKRTKISLPEETIKKYKQQISKYLLDPGAHMVVCDEGHIIKNQKGATNRAITKVKTRRRIILTGTPVQNALHEYYAMVEWIKPNILGTIHEFNNIYANPIKDGQNKDSTDHQIKKMKQKSYVLNKNLSKFVQRKDAQVLKEFLPKKYEYCISVPLTRIQEQLYNSCLQANRDGEMGRNLLPIYTALRKIWTHPLVLQYAYERAIKGENKFSSAIQPKKKDAFNEDDDEPDDIFDTSQGTTAVTNNWWNSMLTETEMNSLTSSHKMLLLFEILRLCELKKEKILIFSSFVAVLDIIERFMKAIHNQDNNPNAKLYGLDKYKTTWQLGKDYFRLDGSTPRNVRQEMINAFNNTESTRLRCFLISSKAGGQGINLVAANRCIIVDTSWNPANDNQNIFRIFRLGQKNTCYVYRLVACSTMEERVYSRSVTKEAMSHRVVEKKQIDRHYVRTELEELFVPYELKSQEQTPNFPDDDILRYLLHAHPKSAYNYHEHDSLLENKPDQELNEDEKNEAWNVYLAELQGNRYQLQNNPNMNMNMNVNNPGQGLGMFGKSPISADFLKAYNDMMAAPANYGNLSGITSLGGLDTLGLSSAYFPMSSNYYAHDLLKRFGNYDPLSIYSSSSLPTPPAIHSTSNSSPLMQSVLRNTHNPISALGNMTNMTGSGPSTSSYNANNIPPASNSIFAQPASTSTNSQAMMPFTATTSNNQKNLPKKKVVSNKTSDLAYQLTKDMNKMITTKGPINPAKRTVDPVFTTPNSSENISILPDDDHHLPLIAITSPTIQHSKSLVGTSARTLQVPKRADRISVSNKPGMKTNFLDKSNSLRSLIRPNVIMTKSIDPKSQGTLSGTVLQKPQSSVIQKPLTGTFVAQKLQGSTVQRQQTQVAQKQQSPLVQKSPNLSFQTNQVTKNNQNTTETRKSIDLANQNKIVLGNKKQNTMTVSPMMKAINRQLGKSSTAAKTPNTVQQKQGQQLVNIGNTSNDSISIIRLPPKQIAQTPQLNKPQSIAITPVSQAKLNISKSTPPKQVSPNVAKIIQQPQKRVIDNQTSQTLKRLRISDSLNLTQLQNSQLPGSQRVNTQQIAPQRVIVNQLNTQRPTTSQTVSQRVGNQVANINQGLPNVARGLKPSQQSNKTPQTHPEVVEVD